VGIGLSYDRLNGFFNGRGAVINDGDEGDSQKILIIPFNNNILHYQHIHFCA
jgi:hypothetical protein